MPLQQMQQMQMQYMQPQYVRTMLRLLTQSWQYDDADVRLAHDDAVPDTAAVPNVRILVCAA